MFTWRIIHDHNSAGALFIGADINGASFVKAKLHGANFVGAAGIDSANFVEAEGLPREIAFVIGQRP